MVNLALMVGEVPEVPRMVFAPDGTPQARFRIKLTDYTKDGRKFESYFPVVAESRGNDLADRCAKLKSGAVVHVEGSVHAVPNADHGLVEIHAREVLPCVTEAGGGYDDH